MMSLCDVFLQAVDTHRIEQIGGQPASMVLRVCHSHSIQCFGNCNQYIFGCYAPRIQLPRKRTEFSNTNICWVIASGTCVSWHRSESRINLDGDGEDDEETNLHIDMMNNRLPRI